VGGSSSGGGSRGESSSNNSRVKATTTTKTKTVGVVASVVLATSSLLVVDYFNFPFQDFSSRPQLINLYHWKALWNKKIVLVRGFIFSIPNHRD